jgi:hypothetical protein
MSTTPQPSSSTSSTYIPPTELLQAAIDMLQGASPEDLAAAARAYVAYGSVTGGKSAVTGSELPAFDVCSTLVRAGWLAVAREQRQGLSLGSTTLKVDVSGLESQLQRLETLAGQLAPAGDEGLVDPFLLGIGEIATATRALAEAQEALHSTDPDGPVADLIASVASALHERVKALAEPEG